MWQVTALEAAAHALREMRAAENDDQPTEYARITAPQRRAHPMQTGLVHFFAGHTRTHNVTGCGLWLAMGVTVAGNIGTRDETTCAECIAARRAGT